MIDKIKKEIQDEQFEVDMTLPTTGCKTKLQVITVFAISNILDKHNNEPDYKKVWEEFKETTAYDDGESTDTFGNMFSEFIQELEQKHFNKEN